MFNTHVFNTKIIHNEAELQGTPLVAPEARHGSSFVETFGNKTSSKKVIGKDASLGKTITTLTNFEVDPAIAVPSSGVVFFDEFIWDIGELDANIFGIGHRSIKVEVLQVDGAEPCAFSEEDTVEEQFDKFKGCGVGADIARVADPVATDSDMGVVGVILLWANVADHHGMTDLLALVGRDVLVVDEKECVGTFYSLFGWRSPRVNALAEPTQFISIGGIPNSLVAWVTTQLAMLKEFTCGRVQYGESRKVKAIKFSERGA
jgi:hypothetical protein